jgi:hypothetical protein
LEEAMAVQEIIVLAFIVGAFVVFGATLGWLSHR